MSLSKIGQLKKSKAFTKWDLIVYTAVVLIVVLLFGIFVFGKNSAALNGIEIVYDNQTIFTYTFEEDNYEINREYIEKVSVENDQDKLTVTVYSDADKSHYNIVVIEKSGSAYMQNADCSYHKDCVGMSPIVDNRGIIVCLPHKLTVLPLNYSPNPTTG